MPWSWAALIFYHGNHAFDNKRIIDFIDDADIVRPLNLTMSAPRRNSFLPLCLMEEKLPSLIFWAAFTVILTLTALLKPWNLFWKITLWKKKSCCGYSCRCYFGKGLLGHFPDGRILLWLEPHIKRLTNGFYLEELLILPMSDDRGIRFQLRYGQRATISRLPAFLGEKWYPHWGERKINGIIVEINDQK